MIFAGIKGALISSTLNRGYNKQTNMGNNDKLVGDQGNSADVFGTREPKVRTSYRTNCLLNGEEGIRECVIITWR